MLARLTTSLQQRFLAASFCTFAPVAWPGIISSAVLLIFFHACLRYFHQDTGRDLLFLQQNRHFSVITVQFSDIILF